GPALTIDFDGCATLSSSGNSHPQPFDIVINLTPPFLYDPSQCDLLLDIFMRNSPHCPSFDFTDDQQQPTPMSRVYSYDVAATTVGLDPFHSGLVTRVGIGNSTGEDWYSIDVNSRAHTLRLETSP